MGVYGDLKELILLLESVKELRKNTETLAEIVNDIDKRVVALEKGEEIVIEKAKSAASTAATYGANKMAESTLERISQLERRVESVASGQKQIATD